MNKNIFLFFLFFFLIFANNANCQYLAKISSMSNFDELKWNGKGDLTTNSNICVYSDTTKYKVTITGENPDFTLRNGTSIVPYELKWNDKATTQGNTTINYNIPLQNQHNANSTYENCNGGVNANLEVNFLASDLLKATAGRYSGYLTIIIEPEDY